MERVGKEGVITCDTGKSLENEIDVVEGMKFNQGYLSPSFVTDKKAQTCVCFFANPLPLFTRLGIQRQCCIGCRPQNHKCSSSYSSAQ